MRIIGLMAGTSLDGIDAAAIDVDSSAIAAARSDTAASARAVRLIAQRTQPYEAELRTALEAALPPAAGSARAVCELDVRVGEAFAAAAFGLAGGAGIDIASVDAIGSHGQTLYHMPSGRGAMHASLQVGAPSIIAQRTGATCVGDFRVADIAAGGEGAPLVPYVDYLLLRSTSQSRVALNIGGIANVTWLPKNADLSAVRAFDVGPANMLIDACVREATNGAQGYDRDGQMAAHGHVAAGLLDELRGHPWFAKVPPKSTGREVFGSAYAADVARRAAALGLDGSDLLSTVTALAAGAIANAVPAECELIIASGGGVHNRTLMRMLEQELARRGVRAGIERSDAHGLPADAKEAIAFGILAHETLHARAGNVPGATGAGRPAVLGVIAPGANYATLMRSIWSRR